jgi:hypothetical protein
VYDNIALNATRATVDPAGPCFGFINARHYQPKTAMGHASSKTEPRDLQKIQAFQPIHGLWLIMASMLMAAFYS